MSEVPSGWYRGRLGDLVTYGAAKKAEPNEIPPDAWVLELEDIEKDTSRIVSRETAAQRRTKSTKNRFKRGDVLYGKLRPYLNKIVLADDDGFSTTEIIPLNAQGYADQRFLFYWLKSSEFLEYVNSVSHGINMPRLGTEAGNDAPLALAPLAEQKRIADKLDTLLARIDACRNRLDRVPKIIKQFRQSVLAAATSGRLTEDWRNANPTNATAAQQVESKGESRQGQRRVKTDALLAAVDLDDLPAGWSWVQNYKLAANQQNAICAGPFGTIFKAIDFRTKGITIVFLRHVGEGKYLTAKPGFMDEKVWREFHQPYSIFGGELLVTKLGDPPGTACIYPRDQGVAMVTPDVMKMAVDRDVAITEYLMYFFNSPTSKKIIQMLAFGITRLRIDLAMFKAFPIPLPPMQEQIEIVRRVESLFALADRVETRAKSARATVATLTSATLAKAFCGELVPQDPNDEPASALLERIRAERSANPATARKRRTASSK